MLAKLIVTVFGFGLIILVNWYFLFSRKKAFQAELKEKGIQEIKVVVKGGYDPDTIVVKKGIPVRLYFYRDETVVDTGTSTRNKTEEKIASDQSFSSAITSPSVFIK